MIIVSFGGGVNSTAMLIGMYERGIIPQAILFADTGSEWPETYEFMGVFQMWCLKNLKQQIFVIQHPKGDTLRESCRRNGTLPSKAYGFPGCSVKFKHQLMEKWEDTHYPDQIITKAIGYHAGEDRGSSITEKGRYRYWYPLKEWGWGQRECVEAIKRAGLPVPPKSSCYFCPSAKKHEILRLAKVHPELFADAVQMEHEAAEYHAQGGGVTKGLGRQWSWEELVANANNQGNLFPETTVEISCMCYDGDEDEAA